ncbi:MAG TPA: hypothetical protein VME17_03580 [Bryobacteraceae bacterium]|nr:hypothetical protein [Bryobacteraceae bacterium]
MDQIRSYACDVLSRLSNGGRDVGGVMFGTRSPEAVRILAWRPITCEYSDGETLRLSQSDRMKLAVEFEAARSNPDLKDLRPVGWFVSHPRGAVAMAPEDLETFANFFPASWQVTLVMHPTDGGRADAGFFTREADGSVRSEASYKSFVLEPLHASPAQTDPKAAHETVSAAPPPSDLPTSDLPTPVLDAPAFQIDEPLRARDRWLWAIPILLALGLAGWLLYQNQKPAEKPHLGLRVSLGNGGIAQIEWDPNSSTVRNSVRGEIDITAAGKTSQVPLTSDQLRLGQTTYAAQPGETEFDLIVFPSAGNPVRESTHFTAPLATAAPVVSESPVVTAPVERAQPASAPTQPVPPPAAAPPSPNQDALEQQVRQLKDDLAKERARADQLQNLVRILENRLSIQPEPRSTKP